MGQLRCLPATTSGGYACLCFGCPMVCSAHAQLDELRGRQVPMKRACPRKLVLHVQVGFVASLVSKLSDTVSSEIGKVSHICEGILCTYGTAKLAGGAWTVRIQLLTTPAGLQTAQGLRAACLMRACLSACSRMAAQQPHCAASFELSAAVRAAQAGGTGYWLPAV